MKKKVNMFGKTIPVFVIVLLGIGLVSAALIPYFAIMTGLAIVSPAITIDGVEKAVIEHDISAIEPAPGGELFCFLHKVENDASINIDLGLVTECFDDGTKVTCNDQYGIDVGVYTVPETTTLELCSKNSAWQCAGSMTATLEFKTVNPTFDYTLTATGLQIDTDYSLIYYADKPDRFVDWGGNNPGKLIATFNTDANGNYNSGSQSVDLGINLPSLPDWNINPSPNYCDKHNGFDDYVHCRGAKIWIVPTSALPTNWPDDGSWKFWSAAGILYEKDLITYSDCDLYTEYVVDMVKDGPVATLETKSKTMTPMLVCYDFDVMIEQGTYTITTEVQPSS